MELNIINMNKKDDLDEKIDLSPKIFKTAFNESLVHQIITSYLSNKRKAIKAEKNRSQVSGGGIKPYRQKGTGKARAGSIRSPIWKGGGKTFVASVRRNYKKKVNKKMYKKAISCIFSELINKQRLVVIKNLSISKPSTKEILKKLSSIGVISGLLILDNIDKNLQLSSQNIPNFSMRTINNINPLLLIKNKTVLITVEALKQLEGLLK